MQHRLARDGLHVEYVTVRCGVMKLVEANYDKAGVLSAILQGKGAEINKKDMALLMDLRSAGEGGATARASTT